MSPRLRDCGKRASPVETLKREPLCIAAARGPSKSWNNDARLYRSDAEKWFGSSWRAATSRSAASRVSPRSKAAKERSRSAREEVEPASILHGTRSTLARSSSAATQRSRQSRERQTRQTVPHRHRSPAPALQHRQTEPKIPLTDARQQDLPPRALAPSRHLCAHPEIPGTLAVRPMMTHNSNSNSVFID